MKNIRRDLSDKHYVYLWADGIYFQVRLEADRPCVLVLIGATRDGRKELLAIEDGRRESKLSWHSVLTDLKRRGLKEAPAMAIGDGGLGFWAALEEVFPQKDISAAGCIRAPTWLYTSCRSGRSRPARRTPR